MKKTNRFFIILYIAFIISTILLFLQIMFYYTVLPDKFYREKMQDNGLKLNLYPLVTVRSAEEKTVSASADEEKKETMTLMLYGIFPIKDVTVSNIKTPMLIPSGEPFGLKMVTDGVVVTSYGDVEGASEVFSPAKDGGIKVGDVIVEVNGKTVATGNDLTDAVQQNHNETKIKLIRKGERISLTIIPKRSKIDGLYKLGIWTRDSCAGIGTLTYYDPVNNTYGGLGHSVCDTETGEILPLGSGEKVPVFINSIIKGVNGSPGELCGTFASSSSSGSILANTDCGVFGISESTPKQTPIPLGFKQDIEVGEAEILTTVEGMTPECYKICIEKVNYKSDSSEKNMVIRITDEALLSKTGGIVQGMSGSPIIQNGKIVGAITHVFVNDVTRGYGVFAENMYAVSSNMINQTGEIYDMCA